MFNKKKKQGGQKRGASDDDLWGDGADPAGDTPRLGRPGERASKPSGDEETLSSKKLSIADRLNRVTRYAEASAAEPAKPAPKRKTEPTLTQPEDPLVFPEDPPAPTESQPASDQAPAPEPAKETRGDDADATANPAETAPPAPPSEPPAEERFGEVEAVPEAPAEPVPEAPAEPVPEAPAESVPAGPPQMEAIGSIWDSARTSEPEKPTGDQAAPEAKSPAEIETPAESESDPEPEAVEAQSGQEIGAATEPALPGQAVGTATEPTLPAQDPAPEPNPVFGADPTFNPEPAGDFLWDPEPPAAPETSHAPDSSEPAPGSEPALWSKPPTEPVAEPAPVAEPVPELVAEPAPEPVEEPAPEPVRDSSPIAAEEMVLTVSRGVRLVAKTCDCDTVFVEGHFEATAKSRYLTVVEGGSFIGDAEVEIAEIRGNFEGSLTATKKLFIYSGGCVSGTARYDEITIEPGGKILGNTQSLTAAPDASTTK